MNQVFYVKEYVSPEGTHSDAIERCMAEVKASDGEKTVVFDGMDFEIDRAVLVPCDTAVLIDNCAVKQKPLVFDNIFRGDNLVINGIDPYGPPVDVTPLRNVKILGRGSARILGTPKPQTAYHPFYKEYQQMTGDFWGWRTHSISFSFCENVEIAGLEISQTMGWCICFDASHHCRVHDLEIRSNVKNGDGVNFRSGCHHCSAENITGYTSDDTVACTALSRGKQPRVLSKYLSVSEPYNSSHESIDGSIHHIRIRNIFTGGQHHGVICLSAFGNEVYEIDVENVRETEEGSREATVKVYTGYGDGYHKGDIHDVRISGVTSKMAKYAVMLACEAEKLSVEGIQQHNPEGIPFFEKK